VEIIGERPGVASGAGFQQKAAETIDKIAAITIVPKDRAALNASNDDMMEEAGDIKAGLSGHAGSIAGGVKRSSNNVPTSLLIRVMFYFNNSLI
jgi:hypothetical protein